MIEAAGPVVCPGFADLHCHLREPGNEPRGLEGPQSLSPCA